MKYRVIADERTIMQLLVDIVRNGINTWSYLENENIFEKVNFGKLSNPLRSCGNHIKEER